MARPRRRGVTSADVARVAGVSRTTVSFVLNQVPHVKISPATRARVHAAATALDYHPSGPARQLVRGASMTLALVLRQHPEKVAADALLPETLRGLASAVRPAGYRVLVEALPPDDEGSYASLLRARHADGLIVSGPRHDDGAVVGLSRDGFPVVLQGSLPGSDLPAVDIDNRAAARKAVEHLIALGHRRIACITEAPLGYTASEARVAGYHDALAAAGLDADPALQEEGDFDAASGHAAMGRLLDRGGDFSAVFVASDVVAVGAVSAAREAGRLVPDDLSVVGFDDIPVAAYLDPPLTTVHLPAHELGRQAGQMLIALIEGVRLEGPAILEADLVVRGSTAPPRAGGVDRVRVRYRKEE